MPPIFSLIQEHGSVAEEELYQVFNMGIGMVLVAAAAEAEGVLLWLKRQGQRAWRIGEVTRGTGKVQLV
jgi:phosphoribosylformylglycinamidine cyclo-ligase